MGKDELLTQHDLDMLRMEIHARFDRLEEIITGQLAGDKWVDAKEARKITGLSDASLMRAVASKKIRAMPKGSRKKSYNRYDCLKASKLPDYKLRIS